MNYTVVYISLLFARNKIDLAILPLHFFLNGFTRITTAAPIQTPTNNIDRDVSTYIRLLLSASMRKNSQ